MKEIDEL